MPGTGSVSETLAIEVENIGGINEKLVEFSRGVTVLEGKNATNRTSLLQAIMAAMGSDEFNLKGDADQGRARLTVGDTVAEREFNRRNDGIESSGKGYLDDPDVADLFAFLLESNEARQSVARGENLRELIVRPIDVDEINTEIERLEAEKREIDEEIEAIDARERELVGLEQQRNQLETEIVHLQDELEELEDEIDDVDGDLESQRSEQSRVNEQLETLKEHRRELEDLRFQIETTSKTIDSLQNERKEKKSSLEELQLDRETNVEALRDERKELREQKRKTNGRVSTLQSIIQFNREMLQGTDSDIASALRERTEQDRDGALTDELLDRDEKVVCWTCGSKISKRDVEETLERLRSYRQEQIDSRETIQTKIEETDARLSELESTTRKKEDLTRRLAEIDDDIEQKRAHVESLEERRDDIHETIDELEDVVAETQTDDFDELLDLHKQANSVELDLEQKESRLASVEEEIAEIETLRDDRADVVERRKQIVETLAELRSRIDRLEQSAIDEFNSHMEDVLDILEYGNISRVWIRRRKREVRRGRQTETERVFDLHIARTSESGQTYNGTVDTLSESEREVVGLVFALAGYLVYDLHETVPVMLMDSLEAIDSNRIARLIDYFAAYPDFLVIALLPGDANAIEFEHESILQD